MNVLAAMKASGILSEGLQQEQDVFLTNRFVAKAILRDVSSSSEQVSVDVGSQSSGHIWAAILGALVICVAGIVIAFRRRVHR